MRYAKPRPRPPKIISSKNKPLLPYQTPGQAYPSASRCLSDESNDVEGHPTFDLEEVAYFSMIFIFGGLGLGLAYLIEEKKARIPDGANSMVLAHRLDLRKSICPQGPT